MRLTIAVPSAHIDIANQYAMALGYSEADSFTYRFPAWGDAQGNVYSVASLPVSDGFVGAATSPLMRPDWDAGNIINMTQAAQAQALVVLWVAGSDTAPPAATLEQITAIVGMDAMSAVTAMGLHATRDEIP